MIRRILPIEFCKISPGEECGVGGGNEVNAYRPTRRVVSRL